MAITVNWGAMGLGSVIAFVIRLVHIWTVRRSSIGYYRHGVNGDNKSCWELW